MLRYTHVFKLYKVVPDDGSCKPKRVAVRDMTLQCCSGRYIVVCLDTVIGVKVIDYCVRIT